MFQFLIAEPNQSFKRNLVAEPMIGAQFEDLCIDEAFDQAEYVGVGATLNLAHESLFVGRKRREFIDKRKAVRQKLCGCIKQAPADHVLVDVPPNLFGGLYAACVALAIADRVD